MLEKTVSRDRIEMNELSHPDILLHCDKIGVIVPPRISLQPGTPGIRVGSLELDTIPFWHGATHTDCRRRCLAIGGTHTLWALIYKRLILFEAFKYCV